MASSAGAADPLRSWNEEPSKGVIIAFVERVTKEAGPDFVPVSERVAVFDNDGTPWPEQPTYVHVAFTLDRIKAQIEAHPDLRDRLPFKAAIEGDLEAILSGTPRDCLELLAATYAGMSPEEFDRIVADWLAKAKHPRFDRPYTELAYQPMLGLMAYLRANGFKTFIVSGGGIELCDRGPSGSTASRPSR